MKKWEKIAAVVGVPSIENTSEGVYLLEEHMDTLEARLATDEELAARNITASGTIATLTEQLNTANSNAASLQSLLDANTKELETSTSSLETAKAKIVELDAKIAARATDGNDPGATGAESSKDDAPVKYPWSANKFGKKKVKP